MSQDPCQHEAETLREAINDWIQASDNTRRFWVTTPDDPEGGMIAYPPGYFREMQQSYEAELEARIRYIEANHRLFNCKLRHGLID